MKANTSGAHQSSFQNEALNLESAAQRSGERVPWEGELESVQGYGEEPRSPSFILISNELEGEVYAVVMDSDVTFGFEDVL